MCGERRALVIVRDNSGRGTCKGACHLLQECRAENGDKKTENRSDDGYTIRHPISRPSAFNGTLHYTTPQIGENVRFNDGASLPSQLELVLSIAAPSTTECAYKQHCLRPSGSIKGAPRINDSVNSYFIYEGYLRSTTAIGHRRRIGSGDLSILYMKAIYYQAALPSAIGGGLIGRLWKQIGSGDSSVLYMKAISTRCRAARPSAISIQWSCTMLSDIDWRRRRLGYFRTNANFY